MHRTHLLIFTFSHFHILTLANFLILESDFFGGGVAGAVGGGEGDFAAGKGGVGGGSGVLPLAFDQGGGTFFEGAIVGSGDFDLHCGYLEGIGCFDDDFFAAGVAGVGAVVYIGDLGWAEVVGHCHIVGGYILAFFGFGGVGFF